MCPDDRPVLVQARMQASSGGKRPEAAVGSQNSGDANGPLRPAVRRKPAETEVPKPEVLSGGQHQRCRQ